jgi:hypothetical protein
MLDQRLKTRFELHLPFEIHHLADRTKVTGLTRNVSAAAVLFDSPAPAAIGTKIQYSFKLPNPPGISADVRVHCVGEVVRAEAGQFVASIESYDIVREIVARVAA